MPYRIEYSPEVETHLRFLTVRQRNMVLDGVLRHLSLQPKVETQNRKRMRPNLLATWELRIGAMRIFFDIQDEPEQIVFIRAVGVKEGNRLRIEGKEIIL